MLQHADFRVAQAYLQVHSDLVEASDPDPNLETVVSFGGPALYGKWDPYNSTPEFRHDDRIFVSRSCALSVDLVCCLVPCLAIVLVRQHQCGRIRAEAERVYFVYLVVVRGE